MKSKFNLGQCVATPGALESLRESGQNPGEFLSRHVQGDWGEVCDDDKLANDQSLIDGSRLLSAYRTLKGTNGSSPRPLTIMATVRPQPCSCRAITRTNYGDMLMAWYRKFYRCPCGHEWEDEWDCLCNDRCPNCNAEIEPYAHEEVEAEAEAG